MRVGRGQGGCGDAGLLYRVASGESRAIVEFVDRHGDRVWRMAVARTDSMDGAEKLSRRIFLNVWRLSSIFRDGNLDEREVIWIAVKLSEDVRD